MESVYRTRLNDNGRILIPAECRKQLGLRDNEELLLRVDERGLHVTPVVQSLREFRDRMRENLPADARLLDELRLLRAQDVE